MEGMSRKETIEDLVAFLAEGTPNAIVSPSIVQRLDFSPKLSIPLEFGRLDGHRLRPPARNLLLELARPGLAPRHRA